MSIGIVVWGFLNRIQFLHTTVFSSDTCFNETDLGALEVCLQGYVCTCMTCVLLGMCHAYGLVKMVQSRNSSCGWLYVATTDNGLIANHKSSTFIRGF